VTDPRDTLSDPAPAAPDAYDDPFERERERAAAYEAHLAYEREQDQLAGEELAGGEALDAAPPSDRRVPVTTAVLAVLVVGFLFMLAGIELEKLLGGPEQPAPPPPTGAAGAEDGLVGGEVIAVRDRTLYVREDDGRTLKVEAGPGSRVAVGRLAGLGALRPGQQVVAETGRPGAPAESITVVPPRERSR
jgi:hypothetical protein